MIQKYNIDFNHILKQQPITVVDKRDQMLRTKTIPLADILWKNHSYEKVTSEREEDMQVRYPHSFNVANK